MTARAEQSMSTFGALTLAAMVGATVALLYAPRKGSETRDQIRLKMRQAKLRSQDKMNDAKAKTQEGVDKLKSTSDKVSESATDSVAEARSQVEDTIAESQPKTTGRRSTP